MTEKFPVKINEIDFDLVANYRGSGDKLIFLLHALGASKESFDDIWHLSKFDQFSILAIDLPGHGSSSKPNNFQYRLEDQASLCSQVLSTVSFDQLHIVGHSLGGAIGLLLSLEIIESAASFCSVEGNLIAEDCGYVSRGAASVSFEEFRYSIMPELRKIYAGYADLDLVSEIGFYRTSKSLVEWSDSGRLLEIFLGLDCRKEYIYGEMNADLPTIKKLEGIATNEIEGCGHFLMIDNPKGFYERLFAHLDTHMDLDAA